MRRKLLAIGLALLWGVTTVVRPVSAADMPVKAPPPPVETPYEFCYLCLLLIVPPILCITHVICPENEERPVTNGAPKPAS